MKLFGRNKHPTAKDENPTEGSKLAMISTYNEHYYSWNGKLYESDIVRACIRPKVKAVGKLVGKHIRDDIKNGLTVNPDARIRFLLSEPNTFMTGQQMQEKVTNQLCLNNNAFILMIRNENGVVVQLYPIPCVSAEAIYNKQGELFLKFQYRNGKFGIFRYSDVIHLRQDYNNNDIFGESPAPALAQMMEVIGTIDQGMVKAIKNSGIVQWLLKFTTSMRPEDVKKNVQEFVKNYLDVSSETFGAAGVDSKADIQRIEPKDYVPNAIQTEKTVDRIYSFFNTNKKIVQSNYSENDWNAYYEAEVEPIVIAFGNGYSIGLFSRKERGFNNQIVFEANNLQCASLTTKLAFQAMVDRGAMLPNEWRATMNLVPIPGGDEPIRRLDTQVVNMVQTALKQMNADNYAEITNLISGMLGLCGKENKKSGKN